MSAAMAAAIPSVAMFSAMKAAVAAAASATFSAMNVAASTAKSATHVAAATIASPICLMKLMKKVPAVVASVATLVPIPEKNSPILPAHDCMLSAKTPTPVVIVDQALE